MEFSAYGAIAFREIHPPVLSARGATFNVRYADGGTESFIWLKVLSTDPDLMVKSKGDLKKGSGNVESKNCG